MEQLLQVGVITQPHGVRGEVKVFPTTDDPVRFKKLKKVILDTGKEKLDLEVEHVKFFKQFVIVKFKDMIGMKVITEDGTEFGTLSDVMETGANDVYVIDSKEHGEVLMPAIKECVLNVDMESGIITVHLMNGLI